MSDLVKYSEETFESIKHVNEYGQEYWLARELQPILDYAQWRNFNEAIDRAKLACENSGIDPSDHFAEVSKTIPMPKNATKDIPDYTPRATIPMRMAARPAAPGHTGGKGHAEKRTSRCPQP